MMIKRWQPLLGCVAVGAAAIADGIVIGRLENGGVDVAAGETETITSPLEISAGVVDATTCPGYVTGRGKLDVRPNGTIVLFR